MNPEALVQWKSRIFEDQQQVRQTKPPFQTSLFDLTPSQWNSDAIEPFSIKLHTSLFYELPDWGDFALSKITTKAIDVWNTLPQRSN
jgi:hypothetical protein